MDDLYHYHFAATADEQLRVLLAEQRSANYPSVKYLGERFLKLNEIECMRQTSYPMPAVLDGYVMDYDFVRDHVDSVLHPSKHDIEFLSSLLAVQPLSTHFDTK
jgi:hypothetical protein